jgi:hypothetical protein
VRPSFPRVGVAGEGRVVGCRGAAARHVSVRLGGPVLWMVPSGSRIVIPRLGPRVIVQSSRWMLVWWRAHTGRRFADLLWRCSEFRMAHGLSRHLTTSSRVPSIRRWDSRPMRGQSKLDRLSCIGRDIAGGQRSPTLHERADDDPGVVRALVPVFEPRPVADSPTRRQTIKDVRPCLGRFASRTIELAGPMTSEEGLT